VARSARALWVLEDRARTAGIWTKDGTWDRILDRVIVKDDAVGNVEWTFSIDSSSVRAHQHAAGAEVISADFHAATSALG
jgi:polyisoprenoid-binding protein YceI